MFRYRCDTKSWILLVRNFFKAGHLDSALTTRILYHLATVLANGWSDFKYIYVHAYLKAKSLNMWRPCVVQRKHAHSEALQRVHRLVRIVRDMLRLGPPKNYLFMQ